MVVVLTTTNASDQTWDPTTIGAAAGDLMHVEVWGAGAGGSGGNTSNRAGGAGGNWAHTYYTLPDTSTIAYRIQAGGAGTGSANSNIGPDGRFGAAALNLIPNSTNFGAVIGTPGTLPLGWSTLGISGSLAADVVGIGTDSGHNYVDIRIHGNTPGTTFDIIPAAINNNGGQNNSIPMAASLAYTVSLWIKADNQTNVSGSLFQYNYNTVAGVYVSTSNAIGTLTISTTLTQRTGTATSAATAASVIPTIHWVVAATNTAVDFTVRIADVQIKQEASFSSFQATPTAYVLAKGGGATSGTTGGTSPVPANSYGLLSYRGGNGATRTQGGGGGGSAGLDGAGNSATTGTGGSGDAGSGGAANTSNVEGGGGGTAGNPANAGGAPGAGGGANTSTGNGAAGGQAQIRITPFFAAGGEADGSAGISGNAQVLSAAVAAGFPQTRRRLSLLVR